MALDLVTFSGDSTPSPVDLDANHAVLAARIRDVGHLNHYLTAAEIAETQGTPITFTAALTAATSGTLTAAWTGVTQTNLVTFSSGEHRWCAFTNASASVTWGSPVTATAAASVAIGSTDITAALNTAQLACRKVLLAPGVYTLDNFKHLNARSFEAVGGLNTTFIRQKVTGNPAWWCVAKTGVYQTQIVGPELKGVWFLGKSGATVASCIIESASPYVVTQGKFLIGGSGGLRTLEMICGTALENYGNQVAVFQDDPDGRSGGVGSTGTAVILKGTYNEYWTFIAKPGNGIAVIDNGSDNVHKMAVAEGQFQFIGQDNIVNGPKVEAWTGTAQSSAIAALGSGTTLINPKIVNVARSKITTAGIELNGGGGNRVSITNLRITGQAAVSATTATLTNATSATLTAAFTADATSVYKGLFAFSATLTAAPSGATSGTLSAAWTGSTELVDVTFSSGYTRKAQVTNGSTAISWIGAITATTAITITQTRDVTCTNGSTAVSWSGGVSTSAATFTLIVNVPEYPIAIPDGNYGVINGAETPHCRFKVDAYVPAYVRANIQFLGDCSTLTTGSARIYDDNGTASLAAASSVAVTFNRPQPDTSYRVNLGPATNNTYWVTARTVFGFTINASASVTASVDWNVSR